MRAGNKNTKNNTIKEKCYQVLKNEIVTGFLRPGSVLIEQELIEKFSIGRTPLREVLLRFQNDGLIIRVPRGGTVIAPLDIKNFLYLMETRTPLELFAAELECKRITSIHLDDLKENLEKLLNLSHNIDERFTFASLEIEFHFLVYRATQNPELEKLLQNLHDKCSRIWYCLMNINDDVSFGLNDLREIYQALSNRNANVLKKVIKGHLKGLENEVIRRINA